MTNNNDHEERAPLPSPEDVARMTAEAVKAFNYSSEQLRGLGTMLVSMAHSAKIDCDGLADEFAQRSSKIAGTVRTVATSIYSQAQEVARLHSQLDVPVPEEAQRPHLERVPPDLEARLAASLDEQPPSNGRPLPSILRGRRG